LGCKEIHRGLAVQQYDLPEVNLEFGAVALLRLLKAAIRGSNCLSICELVLPQLQWETSSSESESTWQTVHLHLLLNSF
jgi:hypothetical protein